jgi:hypothetical protein
MRQYEFQESCALNWWLEKTQLSLPDLRGFHVANENPGRYKSERMRLGALRKKMGVMSGVCDWFFYYLPDVRIAIELKKPESVGKTYASKEEREWLEFFSRCGFRAEVCRGWREAQAVVLDELKKGGVDEEGSSVF